MQKVVQFDDGCVYYPFHDGGRYHIETSPLICRANPWTGFYMITVSVMKGLNHIITIAKTSTVKI